MGWVNDAVARLRSGEAVRVRPTGGSMRGRIGRRGAKGTSMSEPLSRLLVGILYLVGLLGMTSCSKSDTSAQQAGSGSSGNTSPVVVFRNANGQQLSDADLADGTGNFDWSILGGENVPAHAQELHQQGRAEGQKGNYAQALDLLRQASVEAPVWPYPVYDAAFTYLLEGDAETADRYYQRVDQMAPRGFFTTKTALDCLRRERSGDLKPGMYKAQVSLEWEDDKAKKRSILEQVVMVCPKFPAAWKELLVLRTDDAGKLDEIEHGLAEQPDGETKGILLINKAIILNRQGKRDEATAILGDLALDPQSTLATESLAKYTLRNIREHG